MFVNKINQNTLRFTLLYLVFSILFIYLLFIIYKLQITSHIKYSKIKQEQISYVPDTAGSRGSIYARRLDGELMPLATMKFWYKLVLIPKDIPVEYENRLYEKLTIFTEISRDEYDKKVAKKQDPYEELSDISPEVAASIEEIGLVGVKTYKFNLREYPMGKVGAKVLGFVGGGDGGTRGRSGIEKYYDDMLTDNGKNKVYDFISSLYLQKNMYEKGLSTKREDEVLGQDIVTTLEPNVMKYLYEVLLDLNNKWRAETVAAVIMNVQTGEIVAMEALPTYDPNLYSEYDNKNFINPLVQGVYELGSIFKPITIAIGIEEGKITPESTYEDKGSVKMDGYTIKNFDGKIRGLVTMQIVLSQSLNTGLVHLMMLLGKNAFREGIFKFELNKETGIDLPGELSNKVQNLNSKQNIDYATISFGQGIALTPISMLRSLSSIASDGELKTPYIVSARKTKNGEEIDISPSQNKIQSVSKKTANIVKEMMVKIVDEELGKGKYKDSKYKVGAKTGTAQLSKDKGGYYEDRFLHSYFTFFGSGDTEFALLMFQVNPSGSELSSVTLSPYADKIKTFMTNYYSIIPDRDLDKK